MPIVQQGTVNTTALIVPDLYVQIVAPQNLVLNGVPTNLIGVVGSASWGPLNQPVIVGSMTEYAQCFGAIQARKYDMGTAVATAVQQGAQAFRCVRVSDGTDSAASVTYMPSGTEPSIIAAALHTGSGASNFATILPLLMAGFVLPVAVFAGLGNLYVSRTPQAPALAQAFERPPPRR